MLHIKRIIICSIYSIIILPQAVARCLCSRQCSVICSKTARHEQGRPPRGHPQQMRGMIPKASAEDGISPATESLYSMQKLCPEPGRKLAIPCRGAASWRQGSAVGGGREAAGNAAQLLSAEFNPRLLSTATCIF